MEARSYEPEIIDNLSRLTDEEKRQVLELVQHLGRLNRVNGEPMKNLIHDAVQAAFSQEDLREIEAAIEEGCEQIDFDEWDLPS